jgi:hypothetical protein
MSLSQGVEKKPPKALASVSSPLKNVKPNNKTKPIVNKKSSSSSSSQSSSEEEEEGKEKIELKTLKTTTSKINANLNENEKKVFFKIVRGPFYLFSSILLLFVTVMIFVAYFTNNWQTSLDTNLQYNQNGMLEYVIRFSFFLEFILILLCIEVVLLSHSDSKYFLSNNKIFFIFKR